MQGEWLVVSLGGQPQIFTFLLDALLEKGIRPEVVEAVFPGGNARYQQAHHRLKEEFQHHPPYRGIEYRWYGLRDREGRPLPDLDSERHLDAAWEQIRDRVRSLKQQGYRLHFGITGGRRALGLMLYAAAMTYGSPQDKVWHIYTPPEWLPRVRDGARLHLPQGTVSLLEIPFVPWTAYIPGLRTLLEMSPEMVRRMARGQLDEETQYRCALAWSRMTPRQRDALQALVRTENRREAARLMGVRLGTLDSHRKAILEVCRTVWGDQVNLRFIRQVFRKWLVLNGTLPTLWGDFQAFVGKDAARRFSTIFSTGGSHGRR